jgi:hypothetical protein
MAMIAKAIPTTAPDGRTKDTVATKSWEQTVSDDKVQKKERGKTLTLIYGSAYHVMNSTYIHLRAKDPNIYMYRRGRIYKEQPWRNTIIEKANTYLIMESHTTMNKCWSHISNEFLL